jgi:hypothetical protein
MTENDHQLRHQRFYDFKILFRCPDLLISWIGNQEPLSQKATAIGNSAISDSAGKDATTQGTTARNCAAFR